MARVEFRDVSKRFGEVVVIPGLTLAIEDGEFVALLGPSGCGKSTTLFMLAGIYLPSGGELRFDGHLVNEVEARDRNVGIVFQSYALYPHMNVRNNISFPLKAAKLDKQAIEQKVHWASSILGIDHLLDRKPRQLSGGQRQRVALARALVREPNVFLLDEPLSNLDAQRRASARDELQVFQHEIGTTTIYVTHDQVEAMGLGDRIAVINDGEIRQFGTPHDIYDRPATTFVAQLVGSPRINLLDAGRDDGAIHVSGSPIRIPAGSQPGDLPRAFTLGVRPEDITPRADGPFAGTVALIEPLGVETLVHIKAGDQTLVSTVPGMARLERGGPVRFDIARERLHFFGQGGERV